jgi:hypothetical protein
MKIKLNVTETKGKYGVATSYQVRAQVEEQPQTGNDFLTGLARLVDGVRIQVPAQPSKQESSEKGYGFDFDDADPSPFGTTGGNIIPKISIDMQELARSFQRDREVIADYNDAGPSPFGTTDGRQLPQRTDMDGNPLYNGLLGSEEIRIPLDRDLSHLIKPMILDSRFESSRFSFDMRLFEPVETTRTYTITIGEEQKSDPEYK